MDFTDEYKSNASGRKPRLAQKLEQQSRQVIEKRRSLSKEEVEEKLRDAEERRQRELSKRVEVAKELEGQRGEVNPAAAARDAPPPGRRSLPNSPVEKS